MSENLKKVQDLKIERTIKALKENGINGYKVKNKEELRKLIESLIEKKSTVTVGGSMTLFESGIIDLLRNGEYNFLDRYKEGLTREDIEKIYREAFYADYYLTSTNALTEKGELYNVDGNGNRVAAMIFGPKKVIVVAGVNKLVKNLDEAILRMREISAPANAIRLNRKTPCAKVGYCCDCKSPEKVCREYTVIKSQGNKERFHVIIVEENLGY